MRFRPSVLVTALVATVAVPAASSYAQSGSQPDTLKVGTLATVVVVAAPEPNWFVRAFERRKTVVELSAENRRLERTLRRYDAQVARLEVRLDSLKSVEASRLAGLAAIDDSISATRARRAALEARLAEIIAADPPPG
jgi:hypothetical protein